MDALRSLGGRGSTTEIDGRVAESLELTAQDLTIPHGPPSSTRTEFSYRMAWARTRLKNAGRVLKLGGKVWAIADLE